MNRYFIGTTRLMRLGFRQNRIFTLIWLVLPGVWVSINILSSLALFPTHEALVEMGVTLIDPLTVAMHGPLLDVSVAGFVTWRTKVFAVLLTGIFSIIYVIRHTRLAEAKGLRELLGASPAGNLAPLAAALLNMLSINAAMTVVAVAFMTGLGLGFVGSLAHCLGIFVAACCLGCMAGLIAQLFVSATAARGMSLGVFALLFAAHILWNVTGGTAGIAILSPLEWPLLIRPFAGEQFGILFIGLVLVLLLAVCSLLLMERRDLGAGLVPQKSGRAFARPGFKTPLSLSWRTHKGTFLVWICFFAFFSFALGCTSYLLVGAVSSAEALRDLIERLGGVDRAFMSLMLYVLAMVISIYAVMAAGILRREEKEKGEILLSLPVKRERFLASHLLFVFGAPAMIALVSGICLGLGAAITSGPEMFARLFFEMAGKIPAIWAVGGIAVLLFGLAPKWMTGLCYGALVLFLTMEILWEQQSISDAAYAMSPYSYVNPMRAENPVGMAVLCVVAALLVWFGARLFVRRDLT